jgi:hypothetical protein
MMPAAKHGDPQLVIDIQVHHREGVVGQRAREAPWLPSIAPDGYPENPTGFRCPTISKKTLFEIRIGIYGKHLISV